MRTKQILIFSLLAMAAILAAYITTYEEKFMVEFGGDEAREEFISLLAKHGVSYKLENDHLDRIWVVPDQAKRSEYERVMGIYHNIQKEKLRKLNEKNRL